MFLYTSNVYPRGVDARERCPKKVVSVAPGVDHVSQSSLQFELQLGGVATFGEKNVF